ncbi:MAG: hypothetical protein ACT4O2_04220 [Beijerinckiaceae bacterium]
MGSLAYRLDRGSDPRQRPLPNDTMRIVATGAKSGLAPSGD